MRVTASGLASEHMALAKVGLLALKTAAKPATKWVGRRCETSERFRAVCIWMAEFQHTNSARLSWKFALPGKIRGSPRDRMFRPPKKLHEEEAVKLGASIMVELSALSVAIACIGVDQLWNARKKRAEKAEKEEVCRRLETLESQHTALQSQCALLTSQLATIERLAVSAQSTATITSSESPATRLRAALGQTK